MQCWKRTPSMERCQTTSAPTRQDRSRIDRAPKRVETEIDWTPPPGDHPRSRSWDIHTRVRLYITELIHKHTHIHTNNPKQNKTEYETGRVGGVSYSKSSPAPMRAKSRSCTRHESRCTDNTDFQPDYQYSDHAPPTTKSG